MNIALVSLRQKKKIEYLSTSVITDPKLVFIPSSVTRSSQFDTVEVVRGIGFYNAAAENMALTSSTKTQSPAKKFRCSHAFFVDEIASKFEIKETLFSDPFFCRQDSESPAFAAQIRFGTEEADKVSALVYVGKGELQMTKVKIFFFDHEWSVLASQLSVHPEIKLKVSAWGWPEFMSRDKLKSKAANRSTHRRRTRSRVRGPCC